MRLRHGFSPWGRPETFLNPRRAGPSAAARALDFALCPNPPHDMQTTSSPTADMTPRASAGSSCARASGCCSPTARRSRWARARSTCWWRSRSGPARWSPRTSCSPRFGAASWSRRTTCRCRCRRCARFSAQSALATIPGRGYRFNLRRRAGRRRVVAAPRRRAARACGRCGRTKPPASQRARQPAVAASAALRSRGGSRRDRAAAARASGGHDHGSRRHRQDAGRASGGEAHRDGARGRLSRRRLVGGACGACRWRARAGGGRAGDGDAARRRPSYRASSCDRSSRRNARCSFSTIASISPTPSRRSSTP